MDNDTCMLTGLRCGYGTTQCSCGGFGGSLMWNCTGGSGAGGAGGGGNTDGGTMPGCPPQPNPGGQCMRSPAQPCSYGMGNSCVCLQQQWFCN
jgi:hypothetical protein